MPYNFAAESFHKTNFVTDFLREKPNFLYRKWKKFAFEVLWGLGARYAVHLRLIGKLIGDFLLVIIELLFARCLPFVTIHVFDRQMDRQTESQSLYRAYASQSHGNNVHLCKCKVYEGSMVYLIWQTCNMSRNIMWWEWYTVHHCEKCRCLR